MIHYIYHRENRRHRTGQPRDYVLAVRDGHIVARLYGRQLPAERVVAWMETVQDQHGTPEPDGLSMRLELSIRGRELGQFCGTVALVLAALLAAMAVIGGGQ